jgi:hypothetical protein
VPKGSTTDAVIISPKPAIDTKLHNECSSRKPRYTRRGAARLSGLARASASRYSTATENVALTAWRGAARR